MSTLSKIELDFPIQRGEQTITTLQLRAPICGDLRGVEVFKLLQADVDALAVVLPRITQPTLTQADVYRLELIDLIQIASTIWSSCPMGKFGKTLTQQDALPCLAG